MKINYLSATFWFNIFDNHYKFIEIIQNELPNEFEEYKIISEKPINFHQPILTFINKQNRAKILFSQINLQYDMDIANISKFQDIVLKLYEILSDNGITILHTAIFASNEIVCENSLEKITTKLLNPKALSPNLVDFNFKFGKKYEDIFYKIISILNEKKIELPAKDNLGNNIPLPLISWNDATLKEEIIEIAYEINDKLSFDTEKNYHTTESYLNKMLYIFKNDLQDDINNLLNKGEI